MKRHWLAPVLLALLLGSSSAHAEDRIVLLSVRFDSVGVTLESTEVVAGTLKVRGTGSPHHSLRLRVKSSDSEVLFTASLDDPRRVVLEYPNEDGSIGRVIDEKPSAVTVIRLPYDARAERLEFEPVAATPSALKPLPLSSLSLDLSAYENKK